MKNWWTSEPSAPPPRTSSSLYNDWWNYCLPTPVKVLPSSTLSDARSTHHQDTLERLDTALIKFKKWVNVSVPPPVEVERILFNILYPPAVVDTENTLSVYQTEDVTFPTPAEGESESPHVDGPLLSPTPNMEESQSTSTDTDKVTEDGTLPPPFLICQNDTATPTFTPTLVSALAPVENRSFTKFSKGYNQSIVDPTKFSAIVQLCVNLAAQS